MKFAINGLLCLLLCGLYGAGCGSGSVNSDGDGGGGGVDPSVVSVISGTLTASTASLAAMHTAGKTSAISDYKIVAQALSTKQVYFITTNGEGLFEFTVPKNDSYTFHILDDAYHYAGPIILSEYDPEASLVPTGLEATSDTIDLGNVIFSAGDYTAVLEEDSSITIDAAMLSGAIAGIPAGASSYGMYLGDHGGSAIDLDGDGVINLLDSDDDGDGTMDEFDSDWQAEFGSAVVNNLGLFTNFHNLLDANGDLPASPGDSQYTITIEAVVKSGQEDKIISVAVEGPEYLELFNFHSEALSTNWRSYNEMNLVEDYLAGTGDERWGAFLRGTASAHIWQQVQPGDVWLYQITYSDGGIQYTELAARMINFIFTSTPDDVDIGGQKWTSDNLYLLPDTVTISWGTIAELPGMRYEVSGWPVVDGQQYGDGFTYNAGVNGSTLQFVFADSIDGHAIECYDIDVVASNANGDNAKTDGGRISNKPQPIE